MSDKRLPKISEAAPIDITGGMDSVEYVRRIRQGLDVDGEGEAEGPSKTVQCVVGAHGRRIVRMGVCWDGIPLGVLRMRRRDFLMFAPLEALEGDGTEVEVTVRVVRSAEGRGSD